MKLTLPTVGQIWKDNYGSYIISSIDEEVITLPGGDFTRGGFKCLTKLIYKYMIEMKDQKIK